MADDQWGCNHGNLLAHRTERGNSTSTVESYTITSNNSGKTSKKESKTQLKHRKICPTGGSSSDPIGLTQNQRLTLKSKERTEIITHGNNVVQHANSQIRMNQYQQVPKAATRKGNNSGQSLLPSRDDHVVVKKSHIQYPRSKNENSIDEDIDAFGDIDATIFVAGKQEEQKCNGGGRYDTIGVVGLVAWVIVLCIRSMLGRLVGRHSETKRKRNNSQGKEKFTFLVPTKETKNRGKFVGSNVVRQRRAKRSNRTAGLSVAMLRSTKPYRCLRPRQRRHKVESKSRQMKNGTYNRPADGKKYCISNLNVATATSGEIQIDMNPCRRNGGPYKGTTVPHRKHKARIRTRNMIAQGQSHHYWSPFGDRPTSLRILSIQTPGRGFS